MDLGGIGIWSAGLRGHPDPGEIADAVAEAEELGYTALFVPGGGGGNLFEASERVLEATTTVAVVTGVLNVWSHEPDEAAAAHARFAAAYPGRFGLGIGVSHAMLIDAQEPGRYQKPLAKMSGYLDALDAADPPVPLDERFMAALGPKMLELARERTAGSHPYFVPVEHTRVARERLGPGKLLAPELTVVLESDPDRARDTARGFMALYLQLPNYTNNLIREGWFEESDLADGGSDRLVDAIVAWGDEEAIAERVAEHRAAGADHVTIQVVAAYDELARDAWRRLAPALG